MTAPTLSAPDAWATVTRAQSGDRDAFAELYERYRDTVFRFLYFRVGHRQVAEDIAGEVWVRVLRRLSTVVYQGRDIGAWIITIARNAVADYFGSGRYRLEVLTGDVLDADNSSRPDWFLAPELAVSAYLTNRELLAAVQRLGDEQREVIVLRFLCGLSTAETALVMGKSEAAAKTMLYRATCSLRRDPKVRALAEVSA